MTLRLALAVLCAAPAALASSFTSTGDDLERAQHAFQLAGQLRVRGLGYGNLPPPTALDDPNRPFSTQGDLRARLDAGVLSESALVALKARLDLLDAMPLGAGAVDASMPYALKLRRIWGEALTPIGLFSAGRMGNHWGLGIAAHGGDCDDCDGGDYADRVAFTTALVGHLWAISYDVASSASADGRFPLAWNDAARTVSAAVMRWKSDIARERRRKAGKATLDYGAWVSHRTQAKGQPPEYGLGGGGMPWSGVDQRATAFDAWARLTLPRARVEAEAVAILGTIGRVDLMPGASLSGPVSSTQWGVALESEVGDPREGLAGGLDAGAASGDPAPGFGASPGSARATLPGRLDAPQLSGRDLRVDNFRFSRDYHIDIILFREIIGRVTDAAYARPKARWLWRSGDTTLEASLAAVVSFALAEGTLGAGSRFLGVEIDPSVTWRMGGFAVGLDYGVLLPSAALGDWLGSDGARHVVRVRALYAFQE